MAQSNIEELLQRIVAVEVRGDVRFERIEKDISEINKTLAELRALANQGKGSLSTFLWMGGLSVTIIGLIGTMIGAFGIRIGG